MKELKEIGRKDIPYKQRLNIAIKTRDFTDVGKRALKHPFSVEAFNNTDVFRDPDTIGITMYYPNTIKPTHIHTEIFPIGIGETAFQKRVRDIEKEFEKKIPEKERKHGNR